MTRIGSIACPLVVPDVEDWSTRVAAWVKREGPPPNTCACGETAKNVVSIDLTGRVVVCARQGCGRRLFVPSEEKR